MPKITKSFWEIPVLTVYIYVITILTSSGFLAYFDVPPHFVGATIKENVVFMKMILDIIWQCVSAIGYLWLVLLPLSIVITHYFHKHLSKIVVVSLILFAIFGTKPLGTLMAEKQITFLTPSEDCEEFKGKTYAILSASDNTFVLLETDPVTKKIKRGFKPVDVSHLSCGLDYKDLGPLTR